MMKKRGASIIWTIIIASILMVISTTLATFIIKESQMGIRMDDSARAYAGAESGIEWAKSCLSNVDCTTSGVIGSERTFKLKNPVDGRETVYRVKIASPDEDGVYLIHSRGTSGNVNREIEYKYQSQSAGTFGYDPADTNFVNNQGPLTLASEGFRFSFRYWGMGGRVAQDTLFGLTDNNKFIGVKLNPGGATDTIDLATYGDSFAENASSSTGSGYKINLGSYYQNNPLGVNVVLDYVNGRSLKLTVYGQAAATGVQTCLGTKTWYINDGMALSSDYTFIRYGQISGGIPVWNKLVSTVNSAESGIGDLSYKIGSSTNIAFVSAFYGRGVTPASYPTVNITGAPGGTVTVGVVNPDNSVTPTTDTSFPAGTTLRLTANPDYGYTFDSWTGINCPIAGSTNNPESFTVVGTPSCSPSFKIINFISNGDFSSGLANWLVAKAGTSTTDWSIVNESGNNVIYVSHSGNEMNSNWNAFGQSMTGILQSNKNYRLTFRYKYAAGSTGIVYARFGSSGLTMAASDIGSYGIVADGNWHDATIDFATSTFPINFTAYGPHILNMFAMYADYNSPGSFYFDDFSLTVR